MGVGGQRHASAALPPGDTQPVPNIKHTAGTQYKIHTAGTQYKTHTSGTQYKTHTAGTQYKTHTAGT
jgi:hypothetical protein